MTDYYYKFFNRWDKIHPRLRRVILVLSAPIWIPLMILIGLSYLIFSFIAMFIISPIYWLWTGESFMDKYHIC